MADEKNWQTDLEEYIRQGEPEQAEKSNAWKTAIGLQDVDGLKTSEYLLDTAKEHIEGKITIESAKSRIMSYYEQRSDRRAVEDSTKEADIVSVRIAELLSERTFQFSPAQLRSIHRRLFEGVFKHAGQFRTYNITKKEWVLNGKSVFYASYDSICDSLDYDFGNEKEFSYSGITINESVRHIAKFTSDIWQIHPFCEGNTRTTAVFILKYLQTFGFTVSNDVFADNSWYFRNALVRANYTNLQKGIHETTEYLEAFLRNLLLNEKNELHNRNLHISGLLNEEKVDIGDTKVDIENRKVDIQDKKVDIDSVLSEKGSDFSVKTTIHIHRLFEKFGFDEVFGRSAVMELLELKGSSASKLLSNLVKADIIEPVSGHGKGKYKFKK